MELADILTRERIRVPLQADSLEGGIRVLLDLVDPERKTGEDPALLLERLRSGKAGSLLSPTPRSWFGVLRGGSGAAAALGIAPEPVVSGEETARILLLVRAGDQARVRERGVEALANVLGDPEVEGALLAARTPEEVRSLRALMKTPLVGRFRVKDALTPLSFRVYPETPLREVVDLMARKGLAAVPVVGEGLQVLGVITTGEALRQSLSDPNRGGDDGGLTARDIMSRSVLCLTEDQALEDAAQVMVNRDVAQLPVVREGEMVGFLTRESVLRTLHTGEPLG